MQLKVPNSSSAQPNMAVSKVSNERTKLYSYPLEKMLYTQAHDISWIQNYDIPISTNITIDMII